MIRLVKPKKWYHVLAIFRQILFLANYNKTILFAIPSNFIQDDKELIKLIVQLRTLFKKYNAEYDFFNLDMFRKYLSYEPYEGIHYVFFIFHKINNRLLVTIDQIPQYNLAKHQDKYDYVYKIIY